MVDSLLAMVPLYGLWLIGIVTFASCLAVPVPSSLLMVAGGSFAAAGDLSLSATLAAALGGALAGDQAGFAIGRRGSCLLTRLQHGSDQRRVMIERARAFTQNWGGTGVFLSRWLLSPLGPYVNFIAGATRLNWLAFTIYGVAGEILWATIYTGLGYTFSDQIEMVANIAGNISGFLASGALAMVLGRLALRAGPKNAQNASQSAKKQR